MEGWQKSGGSEKWGRVGRREDGGMIEGWWEYREKEEGGREGGGNNSGKDGGGTVCHVLFYSHPEASERRQIPADYSAVLSNTKERKCACVCLCVCGVLDKSCRWFKANIYTLDNPFTSPPFLPFRHSACLPWFLLFCPSPPHTAPVSYSLFIFLILYIVSSLSFIHFSFPFISPPFRTILKGYIHVSHPIRKKNKNIILKRHLNSNRHVT